MSTAFKDAVTVAAPTIVGLAAIVGSAWQQSRSRKHDREMREREQRHERQLKDLDYQRGLLDDAAVALQDATTAAAAIVVMLLAGTYDRAKAIQFDDATGALTLVAARLTFRFGTDSELVRITRAATDHMMKAMAELVAVRLGQTTFDIAQAAAKKQSDALSAITDEFYAACGIIVGAQPTP
ncbi:MAG TPA: hypothetical protein VGM91_22790 [Conexibacter sp.]|jgi:hypothetical protein